MKTTDGRHFENALYDLIRESSALCEIRTARIPDVRGRVCVLACGYNQFQCGGTRHRCISQCQVCDGYSDCADASDEANCSTLHCLSRHQFLLWAGCMYQSDSTADERSSTALTYHTLALVHIC